MSKIFLGLSLFVLAIGFVIAVSGDSSWVLREEFMFKASDSLNMAVKGYGLFSMGVGTFGFFHFKKRLNASQNPL
ncbi:MAG: hypothetical protein JW812_01655 [Alphaproteobacteria bacterium]|nr:hypothetical protein [Alphaproteobacteria bacterium]MBN2780092.1 hypothetical protein [Alphaproteobacteria bacterium]